MPETTEGIEFDELGICRACNSSEQKMHISWEERSKDLSEILDKARIEARKKILPMIVWFLLVVGKIVCINCMLWLKFTR